MSGHATTNDEEYQSAKKVFRQFVNKYTKKTVQDGTRSIQFRGLRNTMDDDFDDHYEDYSH